MSIKDLLLVTLFTCLFGKSLFLNVSVLKTPEMGAQTLIYCAVDPGVGEETGLYYAECRVKNPSPLALSQTQAEKLWDVSKNIVGDLTPV